MVPAPAGDDCITAEETNGQKGGSILAVADSNRFFSRPTLQLLQLQRD
jgi:hypothetical protein